MSTGTPKGPSAPDEKQLYVGQLNTPSTDKVIDAMNGIFDRRFYTNHGPLVAEFEKRIADFLDVKHAICMTNGTVALMVAAKSLGLRGEAVVPAYTFPATAQALSYAGLRPVFCDVDPDRHTISVETVRAAMTDETTAIVPVHLWGRACDIDGLQALGDEAGAALLPDAAHAFGCTYKGRKIGGFGRCEVFSFHATKILNCTEGGCVTTNDDQVAFAVRTARNFHDQETFVDVPLRVNAKMSEAQAAMGLIALDELHTHIARNRERYARYRGQLSDVPGLRFIDHAAGEASNYQYVVFQVEEADFGLTRDQLIARLKDRGIIARRYFYPGLHQAFPYSEDHWTLPVTDRLCDSIVQVPSGDMVTDADIDRVCAAIRSARKDPGGSRPGMDSPGA
ncbi:DegT/DnrJ/EryC1/StrS family aminotransferase [Microbaculum sp. FT89]|uniref:DegT/DnrJ/EryC1/StrS family aminotransferase n=1 Tax=Microbaculum sp. FT89 TaxID=3447298 RepID=UPI003F52C164